MPAASLLRLSAILLSLLIVSPVAAHDPSALSDMVEKAVSGVVSVSASSVAQDGKKTRLQLPEGSPFRLRNGKRKAMSIALGELPTSAPKKSGSTTGQAQAAGKSANRPTKDAVKDLETLD